MDPSQQETKKGINKVFIAIVNVQPMIATHVGKMKTCNNETHHSCGEEKKKQSNNTKRHSSGKKPITRSTRRDKAGRTTLAKEMSSGKKHKLGKML